jgi:hypothetical protein
MSKDNLPDSFCVLPFIHAVYNGYETSTENSRIRPCCRYNTLESETSDVQNPLKDSELFKTLQTQFLKGEKPKGCSTCWRAEELGNSSYRLDQLNKFKDYIDSEIYKEKELRFLEFMPGNACQLACRMCSPLFSSKWNRAVEATDRTFFRDSASYTDWTDIDLSKLEYLKLMGGEPSYQKKNIAMLRHLDSIGQLEKIHLEMPVNLHEKLSEEWKYFLSKTVNTKIFISIDGVGKLNDYVRQYSNWERFEHNLNDLIDYSKDNNITLRTSVTITAYNVNQSKQIEDYIIDKGIKALDQYCTDYPDFLDVRYLPITAKRYLLENDLLTDSVRTVIYKSLNIEDETRLTFLKKYINDLDKFYNTSFEEVNQEMFNLLGRS